MDPTIAALVLVGSVFFPVTFLTCAFLLRKWAGIQSPVVRTELAMRCWLVDVYISFGVPYMIYDICAMYGAYHTDAEARQNAVLLKTSTFLPFLKRQRLIVLHHLLVALVGYPIALFYRNGKGEFFIGCMLLTELSSPFVNLRSILKKVNRADSQFYKINDALILLVFFLCRILIFPIMFWVYSWDMSVLWFQVPMVIPWHCTLGCTVIGGFQLMWYVMFARSIRRRGKTVEDTNRNHSNGAAIAAKLE